MIVAILGIGEVGSSFARDLIAAGVHVQGWDPEPRALPEGFGFSTSNPAAAAGAEVVFSVNWAPVATDVAREVASVLTPGQLYADLNTASPDTKRAAAAIVEERGASFVDGAIMAPVLPLGLRTPVYASGSGAALLAEKMLPLGMPVTVLDGEAGQAATHKLLRSIAFKGFAAVVMECLEAAEVLDMGDYARTQIATLLRDEALIDRFVEGSRKHASRRLQEMEAVVALLTSTGVSSHSSRAALNKLKEMTEES